MENQNNESELQALWRKNLKALKFIEDTFKEVFGKFKNENIKFHNLNKRWGKNFRTIRHAEFVIPKRKDKIKEGKGKSGKAIRIYLTYEFSNNHFGEVRFHIIWTKSLLTNVTPFLESKFTDSSQKDILREELQKRADMLSNILDNE